MKRVQSILFWFLLTFATKAQVYKAGTVFSSYTDIVPDTLLNYNPGPGGSPPENFYFDINGDSQNDFRIQAFAFNASGGGTDFISVKALNAQSSVRFGRWDSLYNSFYGYWMISKIAKPLQFGDSINSKLPKWDTTGLILTENSFNVGTYKNIMDWISTNDLYIGIKYQNSVDTIYGWIRVNCPNIGTYKYKCYVKDYSFSKTYTGIVGLDKDKAIIFPNPISNTFYLKNIDVSEIDLSEIIVRDVYSKELNCTIESTANTDLKINFPESTAQGCYFLTVQLKNGTSFTKKLIKLEN